MRATCPAVLGLAVAACATSPTQVAATSQELQPATQAAVLSDTPRPTQAPSPTATPNPSTTPIPTATLEPDAKAMIAWRELKLPDGFLALFPSTIGLERGGFGFSLPYGGRINTYEIEGAFLFGDPSRPEFAHGYTAHLPDPFDRELFDYLLAILPDFLRGSIGNRTDALVSPNPDFEPVALMSAGATANFLEDGDPFNMDLIAFRIGDVGGFAFNKYREDSGPVVPVATVARVYANSIRSGFESCELISTLPVENAQWPSYEFSATGFYPGELRLVSLEGEFQIAGREQNMGVVDRGLSEDAETADLQGEIRGIITLDVGIEEDVGLPTELSFSILGYHSECEVRAIVEWDEG